MRGDRLYLQHISDSITAIESYTQNGEEEFFSNGLIQDAVIRNFEIIGEAAKHLSEKFLENHPEVSWRDMIAFRNLLIHGYFKVNPERVWQTVVKDIPTLKQLLASALAGDAF